MYKYFITGLLIFFTTLAISACSHQKEELKTPSFDEQLPQTKPDYSNGSLWQTSSFSLAEDIKARRRGDILTILITETASASKEASTGAKRASTVSAGVPNLLGLETGMTGIKNWMDLAKLINATSSSDFSGSGSTTRKENLNATITAKVIEVLPNGNFLVEGRRNVKVNNEDQIILVEGAVRPRDISSDNVVNSSYIADAKITYAGKGIISDRQSPGWLMNFLDKVWPF